jgi:hypothetical protein
MNRLDRGQFVDAGGVAPGEEVLAGALVRAAGVVVVDRAEEIGEAFRGAGADVGDERRHDDRPPELTPSEPTVMSGPLSGIASAFGLGSWPLPCFQFLP